MQWFIWQISYLLVTTCQLADCDISHIQLPGVFGEQTFDSLSAYLHLERWLILRPVQRVAVKKPFTLQNEKELLGWYLFLSAIYWNYFDCTSSINTSGKHACVCISQKDIWTIKLSLWQRFPNFLSILWINIFYCICKEVNFSVSKMDLT